MTYKIKENIVVLGPRSSGKETLCKNIGTTLPDTCLPEKTKRYSLKSNQYPNLNDHVITIYDSPDQISIDIVGKKGLIVLTLRQAMEILSDNNVTLHISFFDILKTVTWLGTKDYLIIITHIDLMQQSVENEQNHREWVHKLGRSLSLYFEDHFKINIVNCIAIGRRKNKEITRYFCKDVPGEGEQAIHSVISVLISINKSNQPLWAVGRIGLSPGIKSATSLTISHGKGMVESEVVNIFPDGEQYKLECTDYDNNRHQIKAKIEGLESFHFNESLLITSDRIPQRSVILIEARGIFSDDIKPEELKPGRKLKFAFFGMHMIDGEIEQCRPSFSYQNDECEKAIRNKKKWASKKEFDLRIRLYSITPVCLYSDDPMIGRLLIFETDSSSSKNALKFIGACKITNLPRGFLKFLIELLLFFDGGLFKYFQYDQELIIYKVEEIYHASSNYLNDKNNHSKKRIEQKKGEIEDKFNKIINHVNTTIMMSSVKNQYLNAARRIVAHLDTLKKELSAQYESLILSFETEEKDQIKERILIIRGENEQDTKLIRKYTRRPFYDTITDALKFCATKSSQVRVIDQLNEYYPTRSFYPEHPEVLDIIEDLIFELVNNSQEQQKKKGQDLEIDIFICAPDANSPEMLKIIYMDNGILEPETLAQIKNSQNGLLSFKKRFADRNAEFKLIEGSFGSCVGFTVLLPVFITKTTAFDDFLFDIGDFLCAVDYEQEAIDREKCLLASLSKTLDSDDEGTLKESIANILDSITLRPIQEKQREYLKKRLQSIAPIKDLDEMRDIQMDLASLQNNPVEAALSKALAIINERFGVNGFMIELKDNNLPLHTIDSLTTFYSLIDIFTWSIESFFPGAIHGHETIILDLDYSEQSQSIRITTSSTRSLFLFFKRLITRFEAHDIKTFFAEDGGIFQCNIPVKLIG